MKLPPIRDLSCAAIEEKPRDVDWSEGYGETWECQEYAACEKCRAVLDATTGESRHNRIDPESDCDGYVAPSEGPMMNFFYPLPSGAHDPAALAYLPVCLVTLNDEPGLALTGGGMDLSWEICEAYMRLGYLPPVHFADLPHMAGKRLDARQFWIFAGASR